MRYCQPSWQTNPEAGPMSISLFRRRTLQKIRLAMMLPFFATSLAALLSASPLSQAQPAAREPEQIRIGFQKSAVNLVVLKQRSTLEQRFKNSKIVWLEFP